MYFGSFQQLKFNSRLRVERRKRGNAQRASNSSHEAEGDRELPSAGVRTRGRRPRILSARESYRAREWRPEAVGRGFLPRDKPSVRARRPRVVTVRDKFQSRSPTAECCELYASLHDRFHLEVRILYYPRRTLKLAARVTLIIAGMRRWAGRGREYSWREAQGSGEQPQWGPGAKPRRGAWGAERT